MTEIRTRLNFSQSTKGIITFNGTVEVTEDSEQPLEHDLDGKLLKMIQKATKTFEAAKYEVAKVE